MFGSKVDIGTLYGATIGTWEWVKTVTPSRTITPQSAGYSERMKVDGDVDYFRDGKLVKSLRRSGNDVRDNAALTILFPFIDDSTNKNYQLKFYVHFNEQDGVDRIETSELMSVYSQAADTVKIYYRRVK